MFESIFRCYCQINRLNYPGSLEFRSHSFYVLDHVKAKNRLNDIALRLYKIFFKYMSKN